MLAPAMSGAQTTLTFNGLTPLDMSGVRYVDNCYVEGGVRVSVVGMACGTTAALGTWTPDNPLFYTGTPALFNNLGPTVSLAPVRGGMLSLFSIDMAPLLGSFGSAATVSFTGFLGGGGTVMQSFSVPGATTSLTSFSLTGFTNLSSAQFTVTSPNAEPYVQFDNVNGAVTPEPATLALVATGMLGLAAVARRRRSA